MREPCPAPDSIGEVFGTLDVPTEDANPSGPETSPAARATSDQFRKPAA